MKSTFGDSECDFFFFLSTTVGKIVKVAWGGDGCL